MSQMVRRGEGGEIRPYGTLQAFLSNGGHLREGARGWLMRERLLELLKTVEYHVMDDEEKSAELGISKETVKRWEMQVPEEYWQEALKTTRDKYAKQSLKVDAALYRESVREKGDAKHKELYYRRAEKWEPKSGLEVSKKAEYEDVSNADLILGLWGSLSGKEQDELLPKLGGNRVVDVENEAK